MPRTKKLVSALALALAGMSTAQAQEFSSVITFGDSLSDAGQYTILISPAAGSFTTNPDDVWTQVLASSFGLTQTASLAGGSNYAYGGAPTSKSIPPIPLPINCFPASLPCQSVQQQIATHLLSTGGAADPNALYTYWAGANDIFDYLTYASPTPQPFPNPPLPPLITGAQAQTFTGASALNAVGQIRALQTAGAQHIVVLNLPDIGVTPAFLGNPAAGSVSGLVFAFNSTFNSGLASLADGIIPINAYGLINEVIANPGAYGFSNVTSPACNLAVLPNNSSLFCTPATYVTPTANQTHLFADGVHPTGAAHAMLASVVVATIQAPGQVAMAAELPMQVYDNHSNFLNRQFFGMDREQRSAGESNVYAQLQYGRHEFDGDSNAGPFDSNLVTGTVGGDVRYNEMLSLGGAVSFGSSRGDGIGSAIDANDVLVSAYAVLHGKHGYVNAILSGGIGQFDIDRSIQIGANTRVEHGDTSGRQAAFEIGGGLNFGSDSLSHGPFASVTWQRVDVRDYAEDSLDSTSMWFNEFKHESTVGRVGWQLEASAGKFRPFGSVAYAMEAEDTPASVQAGSNTMNGHFTFDGAIPSDEWIEADLGVAWEVSDSAVLNVAWRGRFSDDSREFNSLSIGGRWEFGSAAPAPEPEPAPVATTCADMDDDGDGVNNCDDKCPGSTAGEAMGPDGCVVPAPEPEPEMAPQPYRN